MADTRAAAVLLLKDAAGQVSRAAGLAPPTHKRVVELERECYNAVIEGCVAETPTVERRWECEEFHERYCDRVGVLVLYMKPSAQPTRDHGASAAVLGWLEQRVAARDLARMTEAELCPAALAPARERANARAQPQPQPRGSDLYQCRRCKKRNVRYTLVQRRAGDEAPDIDIECLEAGCGGNYTIRG